jgi:hypothetical protein
MANATAIFRIIDLLQSRKIWAINVADARQHRDESVAWHHQFETVS